MLTEHLPSHKWSKPSTPDQVFLQSAGVEERHRQAWRVSEQQVTFAQIRTAQCSQPKAQVNFWNMSDMLSSDVSTFPVKDAAQTIRLSMSTQLAYGPETLRRPTEGAAAPPVGG